MQDALSKVETRKFLPLLYQLAARISERALDSDPFQQKLQEVSTIIIEKFTQKKLMISHVVVDDLQDSSGPSLSFSVHHTSAQ